MSDTGAIQRTSLSGQSIYGYQVPQEHMPQQVMPSGCSYPFSPTSKPIPAYSHYLDLRDIIIRKFLFTWFESRKHKNSKLYRSLQQPLWGPLEKLCTSAASAIHVSTWNRPFASLPYSLQLSQGGVLISNCKPRGIISHMPYGLFLSLHLRHPLNLPQGMCKVRKLDFWYFPTGTLV